MPEEEVCCFVCNRGRSSPQNQIQNCLLVTPPWTVLHQDFWPTEPVLWPHTRVVNLEMESYAPSADINREEGSSFQSEIVLVVKLETTSSRQRYAVTLLQTSKISIFHCFHIFNACLLNVLLHQLWYTAIISIILVNSISLNCWLSKSG